MTVANGTKVRYHGSLLEYHDVVMTVEGTHPEYIDTHGEFDATRYFLKYGESYNDHLVNVRRQSFTVVEDE